MKKAAAELRNQHDRTEVQQTPTCANGYELAEAQAECSRQN